jgi:hypothetical protein
MKKVFTIILISFSLPLRILSQQEKPVQDSTIVDSLLYKTVDTSGTKNTDSTKYKALEQFSRKSKLTRTLHRLLFKPILKESTPAVDHGTAENHNQWAEGKIIRGIKIATLDPFGYSITDSLVHPDLFLLNAANSIHVKTHSLVIKNLLLFRENQRYDSLLVKESARLVRSRDYVRDVYITTLPVSDDSVDVYIRVSDVWSIVPYYLGTNTQLGLGIRDINFVGSGNSLDVKSVWKQPKNDNVTHLSYYMSNIRNSYISLNIQYLFSLNSNIRNVMDYDYYFYSPVSDNPDYMFSRNRNITRSIELLRSFYSPLAKWAGGVFYGRIMTTQSYLALDSLKYISAFTNVQDYWAGRSWQLNKRVLPGESIMSLVVSARLVKARTPRRSQEAIDANIFNTHNYYFGSISLNSRKYLLDRYIFNYGKIEDVPVGRLLGFTVGKDAEKKSRIYYGINAASGNYHDFGYLSIHLAYGTFRSGNKFEQGTLTGRIDYYTRLLSAGNWKLRQFVRPSFIFGINNFPSGNSPLHIGIKGFEAVESLSSYLVILSLQTQSYAPWDIGGFRFGPYAFIHMGLLGEQPPAKITTGRFYSLFGVGVLIRNDYLMFNTFQISLSFYPFIPGRGYNIFKTNAYKASDYGFRNFEVTKPGIVE